MTTGRKTLRVDRALKLNEWLERRLRLEAIQQFFEAVVFLLLGMASMVIPFGLIFFFTMSSTQGSFWVVMWEFSWLVAAYFIGAYITRARVEKAGWRAEKPWTAAFIEIFFGAPEQLRLCIVAFEKGLRLLSCDVPRVAVLLLWLFDRRHKVQVEEICANAAPDAVRILPQLRDISGVIWLTYHHGVIMLSPELRREMAIALNRIPNPISVHVPPIEEIPPEPEEAFNFPNEAGGAEKIGWYITLNLPPFAPLSAVKKRYRELVKMYHPDAMAGQGQGARVASDEKIKGIIEAYNHILRNSRRARR